MKTPAARVASQMPDVVKYTVIGLGIDPPTIELAKSDPTFVMALEHLVALGIALSALEDGRTTYSLTRFGCEVSDVISQMTPSDDFLRDVGFDNDDAGPPEAA